VHIRPAIAADAPVIARVHVQSRQAAFRDLVPDAYPDSLATEKREQICRESIRRGTPEMWVVEVDSRVVGWSAFGASRDPDAQPQTGELEAIYLLPEYWMTGTGWALWLASRRRLIERGFSTATLWSLADNIRANRFYAAAGFTRDPMSETEISYGGKALKKVRYRTTFGEVATDSA
jgi:ribosomal protein S18 acetylase RimI-like enzyme